MEQLKITDSPSSAVICRGVTLTLSGAKKEKKMEMEQQCNIKVW